MIDADKDDAIFKIAVEILTNNNINYWICHGTLLGIIRENRLLPWDHDIDFAVWDDECSKEEILKIFSVDERFKQEVVPDTNNFYMAGNMGGALSLGLGAAKAGKKVIVCGGDAEFVMHMGGLTTAGRYADKVDLTYILFDNEQNKSTGGQNTYQNHLDYINIARSSGFEVVNDVVTSVYSFRLTLKGISGLKFICVKCGVDDETPRPPLNVVKTNEFR